MTPEASPTPFTFPARLVPNIEAWAAGGGYTTIHDRRLPRYRLPANVVRMPEVVRRMAAEVQALYDRAPCVVGAEGARLLFWRWPPGPTIPIGDELLLPFTCNADLMWEPYWLQFYPMIRDLSADRTRFVVDAAPFNPSLTRLEGEHFFLGGKSNFGHWVGDFLPNLYHVERILRRPSVKLVTTRLLPWQKDTLNAFGLRNEVVELGVDGLCGFFEFEKLWVPGNLPFPAGVEHVRSTFLRGLTPTPPGEPARKVYLSRANQGNRARVANDDALTAWLTADGFEIVHSERLGVRENAEALFGADIVVTAPGSGYFNYFLFSKPGSVLINLWPRELFFDVPENFQRGALFYNFPFVDHTIFALGSCVRFPAPGEFLLNIPAVYPVDTVARAVASAERRIRSPGAAQELIIE